MAPRAGLAGFVGPLLAPRLPLLVPVWPPLAGCPPLYEGLELPEPLSRWASAKPAQIITAVADRASGLAAADSLPVPYFLRQQGRDD
jgi:hypothetical protein